MHAENLTQKTWRCTKWASECRGVLVTDGRHIDSRLRHEHNHLASHSAIESIGYKRRLKEEAEGNSAPSGVLYNRSIAGVSITTLRHLPTAATATRDIRRYRSALFPREPANLEELVIEPPWCQTIAGDTFLNGDNELQGNRVVCFGTHNGLRRLASARHWYVYIFSVFSFKRAFNKLLILKVYGNHFKMVPSLFLQLYTIHIPIAGSHSPVVYSYPQNNSTDIRRVVQYHQALLRRTTNCAKPSHHNYGF